MTDLRPGIESLVALNQEMASLVRAGIPLEIGLKDAAGAWPSKFSRLADRISDRLSRGESLTDALRQEGTAVSPAYVAVVEAGLVSGRLSDALEGLASIGLTVQEIRRQVWLAAAYPLVVCGLAYALFVGFVVVCVPVWLETREVMLLPPNWFFQILARLHQSVSLWGPLIPIVAVLTGIIVPLMTAFTGSKGVWNHMTSLLWVPGVQQAFRLLQRAQFARLLAMLVDHQIPAPRALLLAAEASGDSRLATDAAAISERLAQGAPWSDAVSNTPHLPRYLRTMMIIGQQHGVLPDVLRQAAEVYQHRADAWLEWVRATLPMLLAGVISGGIVLLYSFGLFLPLQQFWLDLMRMNP